MSNLYEVIGVNKNASTQQINTGAQQKLREIKSKQISKEEKKKLSDNVMNAFNILNDYHSRRSYDEQLESKSNNNIFNMLDIFNSPFFAPTPTPTLMENNNFMNNFLTNVPNNSSSHSYYSSTSTSSNFNKGSTTYKKTYSNINGEVKETNQKITIDKDGNKKIENLPLDSNKYNISKSNKHKIKYKI